MGSSYECTLSISISVKPKDRERAEKCVLDAAIPVLEEMGYEYTSEELAKELESRECGKGRNKKVHIYLKVFDLDYDPDAIDADEKIQELAEQIAEKLDELPILDDASYVSLPGYWDSRDPDISGYVMLPRKQKQVASGQTKAGEIP